MSETDWFSRGETPHPEAVNDRFIFYQAIADLEAGQISDIVEGFSDFFLIEPIEKQEERQQPYEEVRSTVETSYRTEKAGTLAREKAEEAAAQIEAGSITFEQVAEIYNLGEPIRHKRSCPASSRT